MTLVSRAWMLDPVAFHAALAEAVHGSSGPEACARLRARAVRVWHDNDPTIHGYVAHLRTAGPDEWQATYTEAHLVDWYRVLMAPHLIPTRAFRSPEVLKRRLPDLGWPPTEARRVALGRELLRLAEVFAPAPIAEPLGRHLGLGHKGWLAQDDVDAALTRLRATERTTFRDHPDLVAVAENAYEVLEAAATKPDHVLLFVSD